MLIIQTTDFKDNEFALATDLTTTKPLLQATIDTYEKEYIWYLLGKTLGDLFIADIAAGVPTTARFIKIFDPLQEQDDNDTLRISRGIKKILLAAVYYHFIVNNQTEHSQSGITVPNLDTVKKVGFSNAVRAAELKFNELLDSVETIQWFCDEEDSATYPEYNGQIIDVKSSSIF